MNKHFSLSEYSYIAIASDNVAFQNQENNNIFLPKKVFVELKDFVLENRSSASWNTEFLKLGFKKKIGEILLAQNFVGILQTKSGYTIEILPKIHRVSNEENTRKIFVKMLKTLKYAPFKSFNTANLKHSTMNLFEIFVSMFLDELLVLVKSGVRADYIEFEENLKFMKGKLKFAEHIKRNIVHKERFFVEYDEFSRNRPENRIIKSTLHYLSKLSFSNLLQKRIREFIFIFDEIHYSQNIENDFSRCKVNRLLKEYSTLLKWCRIFLKKESFVNQKGSNDVFALLFPMERIFESYIASILRKQSKFIVETQVREHFLIEKPEKFALKPDLFIREQGIIMDTKWKLINVNNAKKNFGISQSDIYQMFAYGKKYGVEKLILIYPKNENFHCRQQFKYSEKMTLSIFPWNLDDPIESMDNLKAEFIYSKNS